MHAELSVKKVPFRIVGLSATLRPADITDVMRRISIDRAVIYRRSCYREGLQFVFERKASEQEVVQRVQNLVAHFEPKPENKVVVLASTIQLCNQAAESITRVFAG